MNANLPTTGAFIRVQEGGYCDDPRDSGGATFEGVTLAVLRAYRHAPKLGTAALKALTPAQWNALFAARYWNAVRGDDLPGGVDLMTADFAFNAGTATAAKMLQTVLGAEADGYIGPATLAAARVIDTHTLLTDLHARQAAYYQGCAGFSCFGRGWLARTDRRLQAGLALIPATMAA